MYGLEHGLPLSQHFIILKPMKPKFPLEIPPKFRIIKFKSKTSNFICYIIYCTKTGKWYIGSGIEGRVWHLSKSTYHNPKLRKDFIEFGAKAFKFWIYDCESKEDSIFQEQILLDLLPKTKDGRVCNPNYSYNVSTNAAGGNTCTDPVAHYKSTVAGGGPEAKPFEARNAITHEPIVHFNSTRDGSILTFFEIINTQPQVSGYLKDACPKRVMLCFWNYGVLIYLAYKNETLEELELRTGRCFKSDRAKKLRLGIPKKRIKIPFISEVTVTNGVETHHLKDYKTYSEAARMVGIPESQWGHFGKMIQGKIPSCARWRVVE